MKRKAESIGTLSYNGRPGTLCIGSDAVDWYQIVGRLVQDIHILLLLYNTTTWQTPAYRPNSK